MLFYKEKITKRWNLIYIYKDKDIKQKRIIAQNTHNSWKTYANN